MNTSTRSRAERLRFSSFLLVLASLVGVSLIYAQTSPTEQTVTTTGVLETRKFFAVNGRNIRVSSLGNLVGLESPQGFEHLRGATRSREGYVVGYQDPVTLQARVVHNVFDRVSSTIITGMPDFVPIEFRGPANLAVFGVGETVSATATLHTRDGLIRLIRQITWTAGSGTVEVKTTLTNRLSSPLWMTGLKLITDPDVDASGAYGTSQGRNNVDSTATATGSSLVFNNVVCDPRGRIDPCPPPPVPGDPALLGVLSQHLMEISSSPAPASTVLKLASDNTELFTSVPGASLALPIRGLNVQEIRAWTWSNSQRIPGLGSRTFLKRYEVE